MHLEQLEPIPASAAFVTWGAAARLGRAGSSSPRAGSRARFAGAQALVALDAHWHQLNGFGRQWPDARQHRHVHHVPPLPRSHCAVLCQLLLLEKGKGHSAGKPVKPPRASPPSCRAGSQQRSIAVRCGCPLGDTPPSASTGEWVASVPYCMSPSLSHPPQPQLGADAATASCQRCRGGWLPAAALCAGPLASAASPSVISAGQALCFCRCDGGAGPGAVCCPLLSLCSL